MIAAQLVQSSGDPQAKITEVEQVVEASFRPTVTYSPAESKTASLETYEVKAADGRKLEVELDRLPTKAELEPLFVHAGTGAQLLRDQLPKQLVQRLGKVTQTAPGWDDLRPLWQPLEFSNKEIAEAKAMLRYESKPDAVSGYDWNRRFVAASASWQVEEVRTFRLKRMQFAAIGAAAGFVAAFVSVLILAWLWHFLLDRIREMSSAFRGK